MVTITMLSKKYCWNITTDDNYIALQAVIKCCTDRFGAECCRLDNNGNWSEDSWVTWRRRLYQPNRRHSKHIGTLLMCCYWKLSKSETAYLQCVKIKKSLEPLMSVSYWYYWGQSCDQFWTNMSAFHHVIFVFFIILSLLLLLWQAPLGVHSAERWHQSPEWMVLSRVNCFIQWEVIIVSSSPILKYTT